jgi:hypothetical protein
MNNGLKVYTSEELRSLAYKNDIETYHSYIVENAKYGSLGIEIELEPTRQMLVIKKLKELFLDTTFTYIGISINKETAGYIKYKVSWKKLPGSREALPLRSIQYLEY